MSRILEIPYHLYNPRFVTFDNGYIISIEPGILGFTITVGSTRNSDMDVIEGVLLLAVRVGQNLKRDQLLVGYSLPDKTKLRKTLWPSSSA